MLSPFNRSISIDKKRYSCSEFGVPSTYDAINTPEAPRKYGQALPPYVFPKPRNLKGVAKSGILLSIAAKQVQDTSLFWSEHQRPNTNVKLKPVVSRERCRRPAGDCEDSLSCGSSYHIAANVKPFADRLLDDSVTPSSESSCEQCLTPPTIATKAIMQLKDIPEHGLRFRDYAKIVMQRVCKVPFNWKSIHSSNDLKQGVKVKAKRASFKKPSIFLRPQE